MPTLFTFFGLRFYFYANDHLPVHVHVDYQDATAVIDVFPVVRVVENHGFKKAVLKKAEGIVRARQFEILKAWDECFNKK